MKPFLLLGTLLVLGASGAYVFLQGGPMQAQLSGVTPGQPENASGSTAEADTQSASGRRTAIAIEPGQRPLQPAAPTPTPLNTGQGMQDLEAVRAANLAQRKIAIEAQLKQRSVRIANELGLATGAEQKIARVLLEERERIDALTEAFKESERTQEDRKAMREELGKIPAWRLGAYEKLFGLDIARNIEGFKDTAAIESAKIPLEED